MKISKICSLFMVLCVLCLMPANLLAGDYAKLNFIGFSKNGKYLAFEEWGEGDPGGYYSKIYFVDTAKNSFAVAPIVFLDNEGKTSQDFVRRKTAVNSAKYLQKFKIERGNYGRLLAAHLLSDWTFENSFERRGEAGTEKLEFNDYLNPNSPNQYEFYELTLNPILSEESEPCKDDGFNTYKMELLLNHYSFDKQDMETITLQKDTDLPKRRECPYGYRMESVYLYEGKIAVFVNVFNRGFEGTNMRYMVVTGNWERYY